uniref:Uncharacterized protein n=1 Tax=Cyprinus carpio TaxID=7962 RepID=A0A8C1RZA0_CYPCA
LVQGQTEMVRILIENGARACLRTDNGWTPAHFAAESGKLTVLRLLHSLHAPVDKKDSSGDKPVRIAEIYGHEDCVHFLKKNLKTKISKYVTLDHKTSLKCKFFKIAIYTSSEN